MIEYLSASHTSPLRFVGKNWKADTKSDCSQTVAERYAGHTCPQAPQAHARQLTSVARRRRDLAATSSDHNHLNSAVTLSQVYGVCILSLM